MRAEIEQDIVRALAPLQEEGIYVIDCPVDLTQSGQVFDRGTVSVGWFTEQAAPPAGQRVSGTPVIQTHNPQFEVDIGLQDETHRQAAGVVDRVEELVTGLVPTGQQSALYFVRAGFLRLDEDNIWHYAVIFGFRVPRQTRIKEAA